MKNQLSQIAIALGLGLTVALGVTTSVGAQANDPDEGFQSGDRDALYGDGITGVNPIDLIHKANLSGGLSAEEFREQSQGQIQDSAAEYRRLQQERILEQYRNQTEVEGNIVE